MYARQASRFIDQHLADCSLWRRLKEKLGQKEAKLLLIDWGLAPAKILWDKVRGIG